MDYAEYIDDSESHPTARRRTGTHFQEHSQRRRLLEFLTIPNCVLSSTWKTISTADNGQSVPTQIEQNCSENQLGGLFTQMRVTLLHC